ncbi:MAG: MFS transporter [Actinomycetota bacterium]|nr:MFS transporter [Actinomycetota bacterium]
MSSLRIQNVVVRVGEFTLLDDVSLAIEPGHIVAVVGPNGAGKTTLLDAISGMIEMEGEIEIAGSTNGYRVGRPRHGVGRVFQGSPLPETLTVEEVARLVAGGRNEAGRVLDRFGLRPHATSFIAELSTGMRRILDLALATIGRPQVLLLDEPASGLAQSEVELLAKLLERWRDETGAVVLVVEHDAWLVRNIADDVIALDGGRIIAHGPAKRVLARPRAGIRLQSPLEGHFRDALDRISRDAAPAPGLPRRTLSRWTLLRLGLREMSAGMASVLILGVLSRVLKTDLGVSLGVVTAVLASYNLAAPFAVMIGHRSDTRPIMGRRRTPYILAGAVATGLCVAAAPHVAGRLAGGVGIGSVGFSLLLFIAMGIGMYGAGTVFFALLTDLSGPSDRGHAASVVYLELMVGVLLGVALTGALVKEGATNLGTLFGLAGVLVVVLSAIAVWGQEKKMTSEESATASHTTPISLRQAVREIAAMGQARVFFGFMVLSTLFLFLQQAVLTPFAGDVLHMSVRGSSSFSAMLTIGTIAGMITAGRPFAEQHGHRRIAFVGLAGSALAFVALAAAAAARSAPPAWLGTLFLGFASGIFNVSSLALMLTMADRRRAALFMGAWTLAHALADGAATAGGGSVFEIARRLFHSVPGGYAGVFALEAIGLIACLPVLRLIDPAKFRREAEAVPADMLTEAALAGVEGNALILDVEVEMEDGPEGLRQPVRAKARARKGGAVGAAKKKKKKSASASARKTPAKRASAGAKKR